MLQEFQIPSPPRTEPSSLEDATPVGRLSCFFFYQIGSAGFFLGGHFFRPSPKDPHPLFFVGQMGIFGGNRVFFADSRCDIDTLLEYSAENSKSQHKGKGVRECQAAGAA